MDFVWDDQQNKALALAPKFVAPLSILGSSLIILDVIRSREKLGRTYSRLMVGMSSIDILSSTAMFFTSWAVPVGTPGVPHASGTTATCTAQGFFIQLGLGTALYNCSLSFFYLFVIAFSWSDVKMQQIEWFLHAVPLTLAVGTAIAGLPLTLYNNTTATFAWCWIFALPLDCENGNSSGGTGECERGLHAWIYQWALYFAPLWAAIPIVMVNMTTVVYLVWAKQKASRQFVFRGGEPEATKESCGKRCSKWSSALCKTKKPSNGRPDLTKQVAWQAIFYVGAFVLTWWPATVFQILTTLGIQPPFRVLLFFTIMVPMQGFFNFLVYLRPRISRYGRDNPNRNCCASLSKAIARTVHLCRCRAVGELGDHLDTIVMDPSCPGPSHPTPEEDPAHALQVEREVPSEEIIFERAQSNEEISPDSDQITEKQEAANNPQGKV